MKKSNEEMILEGLNREPSKSLSVEAYAEALASKSPTPGGGSASAMVAAFAAALAEMVCNLTLVAKTSPPNSEALQETSTEAARLRNSLLDLATADEAAYAGYRAASALPKSTEEEMEHRRSELDRALVGAADVPLAIARSAVDVLSLLRVVAEHGTRHALSDVSAAAILADAATRSALLNVRVNAKLMRNQITASAYLLESESIQQHAVKSAIDVSSIVGGRG